MIDNFYENKRENYLPVKLNGTTFSGHSFRTTVGNTLDSIFQAFYYLEQAGFREPWRDKRFQVRCSGDDTVI